MAALGEAQRTREYLSAMLESQLPHVLIERTKPRDAAGKWSDYLESRGVQRLRLKSFGDLTPLLGHVYGAGWDEVYGQLLESRDPQS